MQKLIVRFFAACAAVMIATSAFATSYTWNPAVAEGNWDDAANWRVNYATATDYPRTSGDTAVFAAGSTNVVKLTSAHTIATLDLSAANIKLTFVQGGAGTNETKLTVTSFAPTGDNLDFTLDNVAFKSSSGEPNLGNGKFSIINGSDFYSAGVFVNRKGGQIYLSGKSTSWMNGLRFQNSLLEVDDSTLVTEWGFPVFADTSKTTIRFKGKHPLITGGGNFKIWAKEAGCNVHLEFVIPEGGFEATPLQNGGGKLPNDSLTGAYAVDVSEDSPAKLAGEALTARLISWTGGINATKFGSTVSLPSAEDSFKFDTTTLDVTLAASGVDVTPKTEGGKWQGLDLSFATSTSDRALYIAYGKTDGGKDADAWDHVVKLADLATDATSYNYLFSQTETADMTWGSDDFKFVRFYILKSGVKSWSAVTEYVQLAKSVATITVSGYSGSTTLTDFPVLVRISPDKISGFSYAACKDGGADIAFTSADGTTVYDHEIDTWDPSGESLVWVRVPTLAGTTTTFLMSWGDSATTSTSTPKTWNENYVMVWHLDDATAATTIANSSSFGSTYDGVPSDSKAKQSLYFGTGDAAAPIGGARCISESAANWDTFLKMTNDYSAALSSASQFTISTWIRATNVGSELQLFRNKASGWSDTEGFWLDATTSPTQMRVTGNGNTRTTVSGLPTMKDNWVHVVIVYDGTKATAYGNGNKIKDVTVQAVTKHGQNLYVALSTWGVTLDEFRFMKGAASADWVKADYDTVNAADFLTYGKATPADALPIVITLTKTTAAKHEATVSYDVASFGSNATKLSSVGLEYGTSESDLTSSASFGEVAATGAQTGTASGLLPQTTYYARLVATNDQGATFASDGFSFTTDTYLPSEGISLDGKGGDTIVVKGTVEAIPEGKTCTLTVLTGASETELSNEWSGFAAPSSDGAFSLSLCETETTSSRYIEPGSTVWVAVKAKIGDWVMQTPAQKVTTTKEPTLGTIKTSAVRRTATISVPVTDVGMTGGNASTTLTLYLGTAEGKYDYSTNTLDVTSATTYTFKDVRLPTIGEGNYYTIVASNVSAGGTKTNTVVKSDKITAPDPTTYTWTGTDGDGDWTNVANWSHEGVADDDCYGYPKTAEASVAFAADTKATITLGQAWTLTKLDLSAANVDVTFKLANGVTRDNAKLTATTLDLTGASGKLTLDGTRLATSAVVTLGTDYTLVLKNAAYLDQSGKVDFNNNQGGTVLLSGESTLNVGRYYMDRGAKTVLNESYLISYVQTRWWNSDGKIPVLRFEGKHPKLTQREYWFAAGNDTTASLRIEFCVPKDGYEAAPLYSTGGTKFGSYNTNGKVLIYIEREVASSKEVTTPLIYWKNGIYKTGVERASDLRKAIQFIWKDSSQAVTDSDSPVYLDATIPGSAGLLLIIR